MNLSQAIHLYDSNFQSQQSAKCDLLIRLNSKRMAYAIVDQLQDQLKAVYDAPLPSITADSFGDIFNRDPFLKFRFRKVKVAIESRKFTFIPSEVFSDDQLATYSAFISPEEDEEVFVTHLRNARVKNVMAPPQQLLRGILSNVALSACFTQAEPFIESALKFYFKPLGVQLFLQFNTESFEVLLTDGKKVIVYNIFDCATPDEFNYFLLLLIQETEELKGTVPVILSGAINEGDEWYQRIQKYFKDISFSSWSKIVRVPELFEQVPEHRLYSLLSLNACE